MSKLGRRRMIRVALETVAGTAIDPPTTEVLCYEAKINKDKNQEQREPDAPFGGQDTAVEGISTGTCTFRTELRTDGSSSLDAGLLVLFQGCGLKLTGSVLAPCTLVADQKTATIDVWRDGHHDRLYGAMGNFELSFDGGKRVFLNWTFNGIYEQLADAAMPLPSHTAQPPILGKETPLTFGSYSPKCSKFSFNPNNPVEAREDFGASEGVAHYLIGPNRRAVIGVDPEAPSTAEYDFRGLATAGTQVAMSLVLSDGAVTVTLAAPKLQFMDPSDGSRDSKYTFDVEGQCNKDAGDDEYTITMAAVV